MRIFFHYGHRASGLFKHGETDRCRAMPHEAHPSKGCPRQSCQPAAPWQRPVWFPPGCLSGDEPRGPRSPAGAFRPAQRCGMGFRSDGSCHTVRQPGHFLGIRIAIEVRYMQDIDGTPVQSASAAANRTASSGGPGAVHRHQDPSQPYHTHPSRSISMYGYNSLNHGQIPLNSPKTCGGFQRIFD